MNIGTVPYCTIHPTIPARQRYVRACTGYYYMLKKNCERLYAGQWSVVRQTTEESDRRSEAHKFNRTDRRKGKIVKIDPPSLPESNSSTYIALCSREERH